MDGSVSRRGASDTTKFAEAVIMERDLTGCRICGLHFGA